MLASLIVALLLIELILRQFVQVSDIPLAEFEPGIGMHAAPNQSGVWIKGLNGEISGQYRFNAAGWNSIHEYTSTKPDSTLRIAVIGDSYVEALHVDVDRAFPALLETALQNSPACNIHASIEVYSFGYSGSPLSQHLNLMRYVAERYEPDMYIVTIIDNDFDESLNSWSRTRSGRFLVNGPEVFMTFRLNDTGQFEEVKPRSYEPSKIRRIALSFALGRYLYGNLRIQESIPQAIGTLRNLRPSSPTGTMESVGPSSDQPLGSVADTLMAQLIEHILGEMQTVAERTDSSLLLVMDADRYAIYEGRQPEPQHIEYQHWVSQSAAARGIDFIDMTEGFTTSYAQHGEWFNATIDRHWNEHGHAVVSEMLSPWALRNGCPARAE
jgi:hypothetical protein